MKTKNVEDFEYRIKRLEIYVKNLIMFSNIPSIGCQEIEKQILELHGEYFQAARQGSDVMSEE
jgi:hypothetical protein